MRFCSDGSSGRFLDIRIGGPQFESLGNDINLVLVLFDIFKMIWDADIYN